MGTTNSLSKITADLKYASFINLQIGFRIPTLVQCQISGAIIKLFAEILLVIEIMIGKEVMVLKVHLSERVN